MRDINKLIRLYPLESKNPYEKVSNNTEKEIRIKKNLKERKINAKIICNQLKMNKNEVDEVLDTLDTFKNLKELHKNAKTETILVAIAFDIKRQYNKNIKITDYKACTKYSLDKNTLYIITSNMMHYYKKKIPIKPLKVKNKDHNILVKTTPY